MLEVGNGAACTPSAAQLQARRTLLLGVAALIPTFVLSERPAVAGFSKELKKRKVSEDEYAALPSNGLKAYELEQGSGARAKEGDRVVVHFDCLFRGIDAVSSRSARLLGGNRTIAEPYEFVVGEKVYGAVLKKISEGANGLFSGAGGPKPPQALSLSVVGMKKGGKRSVIVDQVELGYPTGMLEIPAGATFELKIEVLDLYPKA